LLKLSLKNFKGVKEGNIELRDFTIILGANNSGKSTPLFSSKTSGTLMELYDKQMG